MCLSTPTEPASAETVPRHPSSIGYWPLPLPWRRPPERLRGPARDPQNAHLTIALRRVLHQPVDGVVGVGSMIDWRRILRPVQRSIHYIVALGAILAANILNHAYVAAFEYYVGRVVIAIMVRPKVRAMDMRGKFWI